MTVEKTDDPAGLLPSKIHIKIDSGKHDIAAMKSILLWNTPQARIERLKRHEEICEIASALEARLVEGNADLHLLADISAAELKALYLDAAPKVIRDNKRQAGTRKERSPKITAWISKRLKNNPDIKSPELWEIAPQFITDDISTDRFRKRVTGVRKKLKCAASN